MKKKTLLLSMLALCLSMVLVVGGTYALFTDTVTVNNHLAAGNLSVGLYRTSYQENVLNEQGLMEKSAVDSRRINLIKKSDKLFNVSGDAVPTTWYKARIEVSNKGSTAFNYGVRILWKNESELAKERRFAEQIRITIDSDKLDAPVTFMLADCENYNVDLGYLLTTSAAETFTVKAEFVDDIELNEGVTDSALLKDNDDAQLASLNFDVQVYATQKTN